MIFDGIFFVPDDWNRKGKCEGPDSTYVISVKVSINSRGKRFYLLILKAHFTDKFTKKQILSSFKLIVNVYKLNHAGSRVTSQNLE